ncbi:hypothetical protein B566_EDAN000800 [Ephemera danica]|nr:hypothetical protein B566_EDAN000800 [Ephemera danica]
MADRDEMISQFTNLTNVDVDRARFYLESSAWQLEVALASFYENSDDIEIQDVTERSDSPEIVEEIKPPSASKTDTSTDKAKEQKSGGSSSTSTSRFNTIAGLQASGQDESSDEEEGQAFYAGGSEHSGQQILGPSKKKKDFVSEMFKSVKDAGAEVVDPRQPGSSKKSRVFTGTGYRLGQTPAESEVVPSTSAGRSAPPAHITLKMWKTGFSVDGGPLREYSDTSNMEFLKSVQLGEVPNELVQQARGREVHLDMEDHRNEDFVQPKHKLKAFGGKGHLLGSPAPATMGTTPPSDPKAQSSSEEDARSSVVVDNSQPTTTVQVRLVDGSRLSATFNHSHTVADLRHFITVARPEFQHQTFQLRTTFPSAELNDESKTLVEANLLNAAVLQRLV